MSQQIDRTLDVIELHAGDPVGLALSETAARLNLPKSATHRLLSQLVQRGYLEQDPVSQRYRMTLRLVVLGFRHLSNTGLTDVCQPELDQMARETGELVRLTVVDGDSLTWVAQAQGAKHGLRYDGNYGRPVALASTATGKCWLATLEEARVRRILLDQGLGDPHDLGPQAIRSVDALMTALAQTRNQGYGMAYEEAEPGMGAVAAAIISTNPELRCVGTVSVAAPTVRVTAEKLHDWAPSVMALAQRLSELWPIRAYQSAASRPVPAAPRRMTA